MIVEETFDALIARYERLTVSEAEKRLQEHGPNELERGKKISKLEILIAQAMFQVFNAFNCRSRTRSFFKMGFFKNPFLLGAIIVSVLLQIAAVYIPFMQNALGTAPLALKDWGMIMLVSSSIFFVDEIRKLIQRRIEKKII